MIGGFLYTPIDAVKPVADEVRIVDGELDVITQLLEASHEAARGA